MSDYLSRLVARTLSMAPVLQPRVPARFEPLNAVDTFQPLDVRASATPTASATATSAPAAPPAARDRELELFETDDSLPAAAQAAALPVPSAQERRQEVHSEQNGPPPPEPRRAIEPLTAPPHAIVSERPPAAPARRRQPVHHFPTRPAAIAIAAAEALRDSRADSPTQGARADDSPYPPAAAPAPMSDGPAMTSQSAPTIKVHIGRIEVRAVMAAPPPAARPPAAKPVPSLALKDYLKHRREGRR
jgi:hypothetical protein